MLNVNEIKKDCESKYFFIEGDGSAEVTFVTDDERVINNSKNGKKYPVREFQIRTLEGKIKTLSLFSKDANKLIEVVSNKFKTPVNELKTLVDLKVKIVQTINKDNNRMLDFVCLTEDNKVVG